MFWVSAELVDAINEALAVWQAYTGQWTLKFELSATTDKEVNVPKQIISLQSVKYAGAELVLTSLYDLDFGAPGWGSTAAGTPSEWYPLGISKFGVHPTPAAVGQVFTLVGVTEAPMLKNDGDFIDIGDEELTILLDYARHVLAFKEGPGELDATMGALTRMVEAAALKNARFRKSTFYKNYMGKVKEETQRAPHSMGRDLGARR